MRNNKLIPKFKSIEEEANYWDTHDFVDLKPLAEEDMRQTITLRVQPAIKEGLGKIAKQKGLSISSLTRLWLIDKLNHYNETSRIEQE